MKTLQFWVLVSLLVSAPCLNADEMAPAITVTGEGVVNAEPDMAVLRTGVVSRGPDAASALASNNTAMKRVIQVLKDHGVVDKDLQTSGFSVQPEFDYKGREKPPSIIGYRVSNAVTARVRDIATLGTVLDALVQAGSNQIASVNFTFKDASLVMDQARRNAFHNAKARAQLYAEAAGVKLGAVRRIVEGPVHMPVYRATQRLAAAESTADVPIAAGENEVRASVSVTFDIAQ